MGAQSILREARARAGLSQRGLGAVAGKAQSEIARIESGRQDPSLGTLERLVHAAGFDLHIELVPRAERPGWPTAKAATGDTLKAERDALIRAIFNDEAGE